MWTRARSWTPGPTAEHRDQPSGNATEGATWRLLGVGLAAVGIMSAVAVPAQAVAPSSAEAVVRGSQDTSLTGTTASDGAQLRAAAAVPAAPPIGVLFVPRLRTHYTARDCPPNAWGWRAATMALTARWLPKAWDVEIQTRTPGKTWGTPGRVAGPAYGYRAVVGDPRGTFWTFRAGKAGKYLVRARLRSPIGGPLVDGDPAPVDRVGAWSVVRSVTVRAADLRKVVSVTDPRIDGCWL